MKPRLRTLFAVTLGIVLSVFPHATQAREFKSSDGKTLEADIVSVRGTDVVLKMEIKQYTLPVDRFSTEDQAFIAEWAKKELENHVPKMRVDVSSGKSDKSDRKDDFDDRTGSFQFTVKILNEEIHYEIKGAKAELTVIGEDAESRGKYGVMQKSTFDVNIEPGKTFEWTGTKLSYKFDDKPPAYWGSSYAGYLLRIKKTNGQVIYLNVIPKGLESSADEIMKMQVEAGFDRNGQSRGSIRIYEN
jgi:hypothetical protein